MDAYDVFLLQASGCREWLIDTRPEADRTLDTSSGVSQLAHFSPSESKVLNAGDILYLPPGVPHHGIARGAQCTTWSIGFRAPSTRQLIMGIAERLADSLSDIPLEDPPMQVRPDGEIAPASLDVYRDAWRRAVDLDELQFARLLGQLLTSNGDADEPASEFSDQLHASAWSRMAWSGDGLSVCLTVNGESFECSRELAIAVCSCNGVAMSQWRGADLSLIQTLRDTGALVSRQLIT